MCQPLTPNEYAQLDHLRRKCEMIMRDPFLVQTTNVSHVYQLVMDTINYETDPYLNQVIQFLAIPE